MFYRLQQIVYLSGNPPLFINSFIMLDRIGPVGIYNSRLSNDPIESLNRKVKDLKRLGRGFRNFEHMMNRFFCYSQESDL